MVYTLNSLGFLPISSYEIESPDNKAIRLFREL